MKTSINPVNKKVISMPTIMAVTMIRPETSFSRFCICSTVLCISFFFFNFQVAERRNYCSKFCRANVGFPSGVCYLICSNILLFCYILQKDGYLRLSGLFFRREFRGKTIKLLCKCPGKLCGTRKTYFIGNLCY